MRLLPTSELSLRLATPYSDHAVGTSELLLNCVSTGVTVPGEVLEAAVEWQGHRVVFLTDDIPYEDMLRIYMFDTNLVLVDTAVFGAIYSTGTFSDLSLQPPDTLTFQFFGDIAWRMVLLAEKEFALPFFFDPGGVRRKFKFSRHFRIESTPLPAHEENRIRPASL